ncbi:MAG: hypothetical protein QY319_02510 [Candidatus Kapaibacterium sp.]|nr:MAG: hypothetical protein F9K28_05950 [Bacteroidota bacterium]MBW7853974.1 hypothetical protein [Candidatus Kapabacteria bacterium]MCC6330355.1 hypothetical protein [Ignavibacteria bacterium]MBZ0193648.1 hypothetical protein [Candidatus Kapabacteria bacterium]MCL4277295.1 hypothetical protein [Ignavibacteria bacterium]
MRPVNAETTVRKDIKEESQFSPSIQVVEPVPEPAPELMSVVRSLWDAIRNGAEIIVTLRQENTILQTQIDVLRHSEADLQGKIDGFLQRIEDLERINAGLSQDHSPAGDNHDGTGLTEREELYTTVVAERDQLREQLQNTHEQLQESRHSLQEKAANSGHVARLIADLEERAQFVEQLQARCTELEKIASVNIASPEPEKRIADLEEQLKQAQQALLQANNAQLAGLQNGLRSQLDMFGRHVAELAANSADVTEAVAVRLEQIADEIEKLIELS